MAFDTFGIARIRMAALAGAGLFALAAPHAVLAQDAKPAAAPGDDVIIVTANKRAEALTSVAMAISVETGEKLSRQNANGLMDYLGNMPNVSLQTFGSPGLAKVVVRGVNSNTFSATTGTYIDDVPFGSSTLFAGGALLTPDLDPSILERVELLKGPQGTLYGASAPGGVLKFITKAPDTREFSFGAKQELSSVRHGEEGFALRANVNLPIATDVLALRVSGFYRRDPGYLDNAFDGEKDVNRVVSSGINASLLWTPTEQLSIRLGGVVQQLNSHGINGVAVDQAAFFGFDPDNLYAAIPVYGRYNSEFTTPEWNHTRTRIGSATITYDLGSDMSLVSATSYSVARNRKRADYTPDLVDLVPEGDRVQFLYGLETKKVTQELRLSSTGEGPLQWLVGGFYTKEKSEFISIFQPILPNNDFDTSAVRVYDGNEHSRYREYAFFGNVTYYLTPELDATVGLRYAHNKTSLRGRDLGIFGNEEDPTVPIAYVLPTSSEGVFSYLANLRWQPTDKLMLYARAASGYRPGGPRSLPEGAPIPPEFTNQFGSEKLWNYEVGARASLLDNRLMLSGALYFIDWTNVQGFVSFGTFGAFGNAGNAESKGFELEVTARPVDGLSISGGVGYADAKQTKSDPTYGGTVGGALLFSPKWTYSLNPEYEWRVGGDWRGFVGGNIQYQSKRWSNLEGVALAVPFRPYETVDVHLGVRSDKFDITLFAKNLFDVYAGIADNTTMEFAPAKMGIITPRTIGISFSQSF